jgi:hypothetical protein
MRHVRTFWLPALLAAAALSSACTDVSGPSDQSSSFGASTQSGSKTLLQTQTYKEGQGSNN